MNCSSLPLPTHLDLRLAVNSPLPRLIIRSIKRTCCAEEVRVTRADRIVARLGEAHHDSPQQ
jgi:hypothetical protein